MGRIKGTAITLVTLLIAMGLIATAVSDWSEGSIAVIILGALMLFAAGVFFFALALPAWRDKEHTFRDEMTEMVTEDQTGEEDADDTDALVSSFRASLGAFLAAKGLPENSPLQTTATQIYWHILALQKRRMDKKGVTLRFSAERKKYGGVSLRKKTYFDGKYSITDVSEAIAATRVYEKQGAPELRRKDNELAHYSILHAQRASDDGIVCPNCGNTTTRENLLDGCDFCGTKFSVEDLGSRVSSFALREDYRIAYDKYRDSRRYYGTRAFLAGAIPIFLLSLIGMIYASIDLKEGVVMSIVACAFGAAFCAGAAGLFTMYGFWFTIFPLIQAKKSLGYYTKQALEKRKQAESRNDAITEKIRAFDPLFSLEAFFSGLQNKLAAIHYAERNREIRAFAPGLRETELQAYRNVVDMDVTESELLNYDTAENVQRMEMRVSVELTRAEERRFTRDRETIRLKLEKSASCKTQAVCAPTVLRCRGCGASISLAEGGSCTYCGRELDLREYDWVVTDYRTE